MTLASISISNSMKAFGLRSKELDGIQSGPSALLALLVSLLPILHQFVSPFPFLSLGELLLLPIVLLFLITDLNEIVIDRNLALFYAIPIGLTFIVFFIPNSYFDLAASIRLIARIALYFFLILICARRIDLKTLAGVYSCIALVAGVLLLLQCFFHYFTSIELPVMRSYCEVLYEYPDSKSLTGEEYYALFGFRPASIFTEPSYFAFYMTPLLIMLLFIDKKDSPLPAFIANRKIVFAAFLTITSLFSTSSAALLVLALIWGLFLFYGLRESHVRRRGIIVVAIVLVSVLVALLLYGLGVFDVLIARTLSGASLDHRVLRGFVIFETLDPAHQLFGVGLNNHAAYIEANGIVTAYDEETANYSFISDVFNRLITSGVIGFVALVCFSLSLFSSSKTKVEKVFVIVLFVNFCFNSWQYSFRFAFMMIFIYLIRKWMMRKASTSE